jgi:hypothetical protein
MVCRAFLREYSRQRGLSASLRPCIPASSLRFRPKIPVPSSSVAGEGQFPLTSIRVSSISPWTQAHSHTYSHTFLPREWTSSDLSRNWVDPRPSFDFVGNQAQESQISARGGLTWRCIVEFMPAKFTNTFYQCKNDSFSSFSWINQQG